jgi:hypothetical protein
MERMDAPKQASIFAKVRNLILIVGGMAIVFLGVSRVSSRDAQHASVTPLDGIANAEVADCSGGGDGGVACGCGDDGGC